MQLTMQKVAEYGNQERVGTLISRFRERFPQQEPEVVIRVPGRVNLIGEHIDYCGYAVHPMAIDQDILLAVSKNETKKLFLENLEPTKYASFECDLQGSSIAISTDRPVWHNYVLCGIKGVLTEMGIEQSVGLNCLADGRIPPAAGLSSSSALVVSAAMATVYVNNVDISKPALADLCAKSERFIGTAGGGMDQAIEILAEKGTAKLIEFNPLRTHNVRLPKGAVFVIANSLAESNKAAGSDYNTRVVECRMATKILAKSGALADWSKYLKLGDFQKASGLDLKEAVARVESTFHEEKYGKEEVCEILEMSVGELEEACMSKNTFHLKAFHLRQRALHVFSEAARVYEFKAACDADAEGNALDRLGQLMFQSHESCSKLYECSHPKLDQLVDLARKHGALGARLTGAGWGGCIVALVPETKVQTFVQGLKEDYYENLPAAKDRNLDEVIFPTQPGGGATVFKVTQ